MDGPLSSPTKRGVSTERKKRTEVRTGDGLAGFYLMVTGQVESAEFRGLDNLFCRYTFSYGPDWRILQGIDHGFSQVAQKNPTSSSNGIVWNFPIDVTFKTTNPHGWPRIVVSVYSQDLFGRYVIRGYGSVLVPTVPGKYTRYIRTFAPVSSTYLQAALGWLTGNLPEFYDSRFIANNEGREVVRVQSTGTVRIQFNVLSRGMASHGYTTGGPPDAPDLESEASLVPGGRRNSLTNNNLSMTNRNIPLSTTIRASSSSAATVANDRPPLAPNNNTNTERPVIRTDSDNTNIRKVVDNEEIQGGSRMGTNENNNGTIRTRLAAVDEDRDRERQRDRDRERRRDYNEDTGRDRGRDRDNSNSTRERKPADSLSPNRN